MFKHYLINISKNLWRKKLYSLISILSLSVGLAVFSLSFIHVKRELSFNRVWPGFENVYHLIKEENSIINATSNTFNPSDTAQLRNYFDNEIASMARMDNLYLEFEVENSSFQSSVSLVDSSFIDIFQMEVLAGDMYQALEQPSAIAIEEEYAAEIFSGSPLGKTLSFISDNDTKVDFQVVAVFRVPEPVTNGNDLKLLTMMHEKNQADLALGLISMVPTGSASSERLNKIWLKLKDGVDPDYINNELLGYVDQHVNGGIFTGNKLSDIRQYRLQAIKDIHFHPLNALDFEAGDLSRVITFAVIGILVLLAGCFNAVGLSMARALERRREIGIRKANGALRQDIFIQFQGEAMLLTVLALLPALMLTELFQPAFANLLSIRNMPTLNFQDALVLVLITLIVGALNGVYPALLISKIKPVSILSSQPEKPSSKTMSVRTVLVGTQFMLSIILMLTTLSLYAQLAVTRAQPLGYNADNLIMTAYEPSSGSVNTEALFERLKEVPGIKALAWAILTPTASDLGLSVSIPVANSPTDGEAISLKPSLVGYDNLEVLQIALLAGRTFDKERDFIDEETNTIKKTEGEATRIILNRTAVKHLGFDTPEEAIAQLVYLKDSYNLERYSVAEVIGVVEDSMIASLRERPVGAYYSLYSGNSMMLLRFEDSIANSIQNTLATIWEEVSGLPPAYISFVEQRIDRAFLEEKKESRLLLICAGLALFLSCIGLYGLVAFSLGTGVKEVGVRKVLGASKISLVSLYLWRFSRPILLANLIAWPIAVYFILQWISQFPYQLDKSWLLLLCVGTSVIVLLIAWSTVAFLTAQAASQKPVLALRYE